MEVILTLILFWVGYSVVVWIFRAAAGTTKAAVKSAVGRGSFSENMELEFKGIGPFQIRTVEKTIGEVKGIIIEGRGLIPVSYRTHVGFVTSVLDSTGGEASPVISLVDGFKEPNSAAYQQIVDIGEIEENQGFAQWVQVGVVIPDVLYPAEGGKRSLRFICRIIDMDNPPDINLGYCDSSDDGLLKMLVAPFEFYYEGKGYQESATHKEEARGLAIKLAMSVAMADGSLDDREGKVIKEWIIRTIAQFSGEKQKKLKELYNGALREAHSEAKSGNLSLSDITQRLEELGETPQKYEAIELCFEVMAADGVADENEIKTIKNIAEALDLDFDEIESLRDKHLINLDISTDQQASIETILHIEQGWSKDQIKKHLTREYAKWNNRINTLNEGPERNNAQHMLHLIAEARKKYA